MDVNFQEVHYINGLDSTDTYGICPICHMYIDNIEKYAHTITIKRLLKSVLITEYFKDNTTTERFEHKLPIEHSTNNGIIKINKSYRIDMSNYSCENIYIINKFPRLLLPLDKQFIDFIKIDDINIDIELTGDDTKVTFVNYKELLNLLI